MRALWLALMLTACGSKDENADAGPSAGADQVSGWTPADQPGPFTAGTAESTFVGRTGVEMNVQVWYPSMSEDDDLHRYDALLAFNAVDTPEPACSSTRPVLAFSHGNQGMRWQSPFLVEHLVSHGFVVVAPDHTGNTVFDYDRSRMPEVTFRRPFDVIDAVDWLYGTAPDLVPGLGDCLDEADGYAVSGHSFGGYTATALGGARFDQAAIEEYCATAGGWLCDEFADRVASDPDGELRAYFYNPNNEGRQDWGHGVRPSVTGHGEREGESSLPFHQLASRIYAFHFNPFEVGDGYAVPEDEVAEIVAAAKESWGKSFRW